MNQYLSPLLALIVIIGCSGDDDPFLNEIRLSTEADNIRVLVNSSIEVEAAGFDQNGNSIPFSSITWSVSNTNASVDAMGVVRGVSPGTVMVSASSEEVRGSLELTVEARSLASLSISSLMGMVNG